jgi:hypothetical protein
VTPHGTRAGSRLSPASSPPRTQRGRSDIAAKSDTSVVEHILSAGLGPFVAPAARFFVSRTAGLLEPGDDARLEKALRDAILNAQGAPRGRIFRGHVPRKYRRRAKKAAEHAVNSNNLLAASERRGRDKEKSASLTSGTVATGRDWEAITAEQLLLARDPKQPLVDWREGLVELLEATAFAGLMDSDEALVSNWRETIVPGGNDREPDDAEVEEWARTVGRAFEVELAKQDELRYYLTRLDDYNARAIQYALFDGLDSTRRALQIIAAVVAAVAVALGIETGIEEL